jgi:hypothetical protein
MIEHKGAALIKMGELSYLSTEDLQLMMTWGWASLLMKQINMDKDKTLVLSSIFNSLKTLFKHYHKLEKEDCSYKIQFR